MIFVGLIGSFSFFFFFQAEDGIRDWMVRLEFRRVLFRSMRTMNPVHDETCAVACCAEIIGAKWTALKIGRASCRESVPSSVDLGGRRIIKKKKRKINQKHHTSTYSYKTTTQSKIE